MDSTTKPTADASLDRIGRIDERNRRITAFALRPNRLIVTLPLINDTLRFNKYLALDSRPTYAELGSIITQFVHAILLVLVGI